MTKIVAIDGGKKNDGGVDIKEKGAVVILDGEEIVFDSLILCGTVIQNGEESRTVMSYNSSVDEMVVYKNTMNIVIDDKVRKGLT